jgi:hypothetical protein
MPSGGAALSGLYWAPCSCLWKWPRTHRLSAVLHRSDIPIAVTGVGLLFLIAWLFEPSSEILRATCVLLIAAVISASYWVEDRVSKRR